MSTSIESFDERARREADRFGETIVHRGELLRHPVYTRVLHWAVAIFFHRVSVGPRLPQPEDPSVVTEQPDPVEAKRKEQP